MLVIYVVQHGSWYIHCNIMQYSAIIAHALLPLKKASISVIRPYFKWFIRVINLNLVYLTPKPFGIRKHYRVLILYQLRTYVLLFQSTDVMVFYQEFIIYTRGRVSNPHYTLYKHTASSNTRWFLYNSVNNQYSFEDQVPC